MYSEKVMEHFKNPKHLKKMENPSAVGKVGNPTCGDMMHVYIKVGKNEKGEEIVEDISVQTFGCVAAIATSDVVCDLAKGKTLDRASKISKDEIVKELGKLPALKYHCSILAQDGLRKAIEEYKKNKH